ncbi:DUF5017 domain-containing protein [Niabella aurantiaca]|uniref:DUF5017 domain-containing protein n=1 Tax=Niabella aurantiaca TaxID=379900 RepID=UPI0003AA2B6D|nr:DUF5017 domain-containing protein [Niabella aurantiaca]
MKFKYYFATIIIILGISVSCNKTMEVADVTFEVSANGTTAHVGDSIVFNFEGEPDIISFYSGEIGNSYDYKDQDRIVPTEAVEISFSSQVRSQSGASASYCQDNQFHIWVCSDLDFTGAATMADSAAIVQSATWTEITDRFTLCPLECSSTTAYHASGTSDIKELFQEGKPLFIAFQYVNRPNVDNGRANIWRFSGFQMNATNAVGSGTLTNQTNGGWKPVLIGNTWLSNSFSATSSVVTLRGPTTNDIPAEMWCISDPVYLEDTNLGHEYGVGIKSYADPALKRYAHRFSAPGVYHVTFVAANSNVDDRKEVVRQLQITIEP